MVLFVKIKKKLVEIKLKLLKKNDDFCYDVTFPLSFFLYQQLEYVDMGKSFIIKPDHSFN